jgi:acetyl esterase/lipase
MATVRSQLLRLFVRYVFAPGIGSGTNLHRTRRFLEAASYLAMMPRGIKVESVTAHGVLAEWVSAPHASEHHAILYLHGGAFVQGSLNTYRDLAARVSLASGARVLLIEYRLAPEHPFPAALDDAVAAYQWLLAQGFSGGCIAVAGDSAGGGLVISALVSLRDSQTKLPAAAVCISPWVDLAMEGESVSKYQQTDPMIRVDFLRFAADLYLAGRDPRLPLASPVYADLTGLPPLLVQVGEEEVLASDSMRLVERARAVGVDAKLEVSREMWHCWHAFASMVPEAQATVDSLGAFLRGHLVIDIRHNRNQRSNHAI